MAVTPVNQFRTFLLSPAIVALLLLFGLVFGFAVAHLSELIWTPILTRSFYGGLLLWGCVVLIKHRNRGLQLVGGDWLFLVFMFVILASLAAQPDGKGTVLFYAKFLPFFVLLPYCLGRLIDEEDFRLFCRVLPWLGAVILVMCMADFWLVPDTGIVYSRWQYFGMNHSPLLVAMLVSVALLALSYWLLALDVMTLDWKNAVALGLFGVFAVALVLLSARGALFACLIALVFLMVIARNSLCRRKLGLLGYFFCALLVGFLVLPKPQSEFYSRIQVSGNMVLLDSNNPDHAEMIGKVEANPRCRPLIEGINSATIRRVLYTEALDLSYQHPLTGVGATRFGDYSCAGSGNYPHSTVLQAFAELGLLGGVVLLMLFVTSLIILVRVYRKSKALSSEAMFWIVLILLFAQFDQIYGNYFMASGSYFLFGVANRMRIRSKK